MGDDLGVRLSGPVGVVVMLLATLAFCFYDEKTLVAELSQIRRRDEARARGAAEEETPSTAATDSRTITPRSPRQRHASRAAVHPA